jgi:hypothetical protein
MEVQKKTELRRETWDDIIGPDDPGAMVEILGGKMKFDDPEWMVNIPNPTEEQDRQQRQKQEPVLPDDDDGQAGGEAYRPAWHGVQLLHPIVVDLPEIARTVRISSPELRDAAAVLVAIQNETIIEQLDAIRVSLAQLLEELRP